MKKFLRISLGLLIMLGGLFYWVSGTDFWSLELLIMVVTTLVGLALLGVRIFTLKNLRAMFGFGLVCGGLSSLLFFPLISWPVLAGLSVAMFGIIVLGHRPNLTWVTITTVAGGD